MVLDEQQINFLKGHWELVGDVKFHRRLANFVYFTQIDGREVILRLTESTHRKAHEIESELHWMHFLATNGMQIANPIPSLSENFLVKLPGENTFFAAVFEKAPGAFLKDDEDVSDEMIEAWGQYLGKMHRLTRGYQPAKETQPRQHWHDDESLAMAKRSLDKEDPIPYARLNELLEWMRFLPQTGDCYGLIHTDLHRGNFFVDNGQITAFDFDDACYQWFSYDFVAPLNSVHKNFYEGNQHPDKDKTLEKFLKGYSKENILDNLWIERIKLFDKYRAALVYHWIKTFTREGIFDAKGVEWGKQKAPQLLAILNEPLNLF